MTTPPLTPPNCDLRDFGFMPLDVVRFRQSDLVTQSEPEAIVAAILLWGASWHSVPAASLTNDDRSLAQAAGYGRAVEAFLSIKEEALKGFILCSDNRLYHPVVAEKAREAWKGKLERRWRTECARIRKHNERNKNDPQAQLETPSFDEFLSRVTSQVVACDKGETVSATQERFDLEQATGTDNQIEPLDKSDKDLSVSSMSHATNEHVTRDNEDSHAIVAREIPSKGQGEGQGEGEGDSIGDNILLSPLSGNGIVSRVEELARLSGLNITVPRNLNSALEQLKSWEAEGIDYEEVIVPVVKERTLEDPTSPIYSLRYFDASVRKRHALGLQGVKRKASEPAKPRPPREPIAAQDDDDERVEQFRAALRKEAGSRYDDTLSPEHTAVKIVDGRLLRLTFRNEAERSIAQFSHDAAVSRAARSVGLTATLEALK